MSPHAGLNGKPVRYFYPENQFRRCPRNGKEVRLPHNATGMMLFREGEAAKLSSPETGQEHTYQMLRGGRIECVASCRIMLFPPKQTPSIPLLTLLIF